MVSFPLFSVIVCAWSMTQNLRGQSASVELTQAHPNYYFVPSGCFQKRTITLQYNYNDVAEGIIGG